MKILKWKKYFFVFLLAAGSIGVEQANAWTYLRDSVDLESTKTRTRCGRVKAKNAAKDAVYNDLENQCDAMYSRSHCQSVCNSYGEDYIGYGLWGSTDYTEISKEKKDSCGFLKWDWKRKYSGEQACGCYCDAD